jgi:predicted nucleic acid-binding protein
VAAISDSSPLILYAKINQLELLRALFAEVNIPFAVRDEILEPGPGQPDAVALATTPWIHPRAVVDRSMVRILLGQLDPGEAEVVALAIEVGGQIPVLVDDRRGRRLAKERGLQVFGSGGVLVLAKWSISQILVGFAGGALPSWRGGDGLERRPNPTANCETEHLVYQICGRSSSTCAARTRCGRGGQHGQPSCAIRPTTPWPAASSRSPTCPYGVFIRAKAPPCSCCGSRIRGVPAGGGG